MQLNDVRKANLSHKKKLRVGRGPGSGVGKTAGRGIKGATSRSGYAMKATYEGGQMPLFRRLPKRGFRNGPFRVTYSVINVGDLGSFKTGSKIGPDEMRETGLLYGVKRNPVKVLGEGELSVALTIQADAFSKSAIAKIEKAGGKAEWIGGAPAKPAPDFKKLEADRKKAKAAEAKPAKGEKAEKGEAPKAEKAEKAPKAEGKAPKGKKEE